MASVKLFLSYAREDASAAERLYDELVLHPELVPWLDSRNIAAGDDWERAILSSLDESDYIVLLLSSHSVAKTGFVQREVREALERALMRPPGKRFVIPLRLDECSTTHRELSRLHYVDLFPSWSAGIDRLFTALGIERQSYRNTEKGEGVPPTVTPSQQRHPFVDREFWLGIDLPHLRRSLYREYFGAETNQAITELLSAIETMQEKAHIVDMRDFHYSVAPRWQRASSLLLWGDGATGKTYLAQILSELIFRHRSFHISCQEVGGSNLHDPLLDFRYRIFGVPPPYAGSDRLTDLGSHLAETHGFTLVIFDEADRLFPADFTLGLEFLYGLLYGRTYTPQNPWLTQNRTISLWNTIFLLTTNLKSFPPAHLSAEKRDVINRRISAHHLTLLQDDEVIGFAQWYLPKALAARLGPGITCQCGDLTPYLRRLRLVGRTPWALRRELDPLVSNALTGIRRQDATSGSQDLEVTDVLASSIASPTSLENLFPPPEPPKKTTG